MSGDTSRAALKIETEGSVLVRVAENWVSPGALELDIDDERDVTRSERNTLFTFYASAAAESNTSLAARRDGCLCVFDHAVDSDTSPVIRIRGLGSVRRPGWSFEVDAQRAGVCRWFEAGFMVSPLISKTTAYYPIAFEPCENAGKALSNTMAESEVAWPFTPVDQGEEDGFIERWLERFGQAPPPDYVVHRACPSDLRTGRGGRSEEPRPGPRFTPSGLSRRAPSGFDTMTTSCRPRSAQPTRGQPLTFRRDYLSRR